MISAFVLLTYLMKESLCAAQLAPLFTLNCYCTSLSEMFDLRDASNVSGTAVSLNISTEIKIHAPVTFLIIIVASVYTEQTCISVL